MDEARDCIRRSSRGLNELSQDGEGGLGSEASAARELSEDLDDGVKVRVGCFVCVGR